MLVKSVYAKSQTRGVVMTRALRQSLQSRLLGMSQCDRTERRCHAESER